MPSSDHELAIAAAGAGAAVVRDRFGTAVERIDKGGGDFATAADLEAEEAIVRLLRDARPDDAVVGEDGGRTGGVASGRRWLVDPLCGTLNFAVRNMLVSVNVALSTGVAAVADPFADEIFWTDGTVARVRHDEVDTPLTPSAESRLIDVNLDPPFPNRSRFRAARMLLDAGFATLFRPRVVSTTLAVAWVAAGRRAGYVTDGHVGDSVHFAAGIALCRAAGCVVTGLDGRPLTRGMGGLLIAADAETHAALVELVAAQQPAAAGDARG